MDSPLTDPIGIALASLGRISELSVVVGERSAGIPAGIPRAGRLEAGATFHRQLGDAPA